MAVMGPKVSRAERSKGSVIPMEGEAFLMNARVLGGGAEEEGVVVVFRGWGWD
jgi:hypothetical protein